MEGKPVKFQLELLEEVSEITEKVRKSETIQLSRNQFYNRILLEWAEAKGYITSTDQSKKSELEKIKAKLVQLENA